MHPILKSRARLGTYLLGWVPIAALLAAQAAVQHTPLPAARNHGLLGPDPAPWLFHSPRPLCLPAP